MLTLVLSALLGGAVVGPPLELSSNVPSVSAGPVAAWANGRFLVAWQEFGTANLALVDTSGVVARLGSTGLPASWVGVASSGGTRWVLATRSDAVSLVDVSAAGVWSTPVTTVPLVDDGPAGPRAFVLVSSATEALAAWTWADLGGGDDIKLEQYRFPLGQLDAGSRAQLADGLNEALIGVAVTAAPHDGGFALGWVPTRDTAKWGADIIGTTSSSVSFAGSGSELLATFTEQRDAGSLVTGRRFGVAGGAIDPTPLELVSTPGATSPVASWEGKSFVVAFAVGLDLHVAWLQPPAAVASVRIDQLAGQDYWLASGPDFSILLYTGRNAAGEVRLMARLLRRVIDAPDGGQAPLPDGGAALDGGSAADGGARADAGHDSDAGALPDGGGSFDGGSLVDAGASADAGEAPSSEADGGAGVRGPRHYVVGCACASSPDAAFWLPWLLVAQRRRSSLRSARCEGRAPSRRRARSISASAPCSPSGPLRRARTVTSLDAEDLMTRTRT